MVFSSVNEDLIGDVKADIVITFPHRSIQEFFGAFFFVLQLIEGKEIDTLFSNRSHRTNIYGESFVSAFLFLVLE